MRVGIENGFGKVEVRLVEGAPHIRLSGECDMYLAPTLEEQLASVLDGGHNRVVFDLERVTFLDSTILRIFLSARRAIPRVGGVVLLCRPGFVRRLLTLLEIDRLLTVCTPEEWRQQTAAVH